MAKTAKIQRIHTVKVQLKNKDKKLLDLLVDREQLPRTEVIRRLIREAAAPEAQELRVANG